MEQAQRQAQGHPREQTSGLRPQKEPGDYQSESGAEADTGFKHSGKEGPKDVPEQSNTEQQRQSSTTPLLPRPPPTINTSGTFPMQGFPCIYVGFTPMSQVG